MEIAFMSEKKALISILYKPVIYNMQGNDAVIAH